MKVNMIDNLKIKNNGIIKMDIKNTNSQKTTINMSALKKQINDKATKTPIIDKGEEDTFVKKENKNGKVIGWIALGLSAAAVGGAVIAKKCPKIQETLESLALSAKNKLGKLNVKKENANNLKNAIQMREKIYKTPGVKEVFDRLSKNPVANQEVNLFKDAKSVFDFSIKGNADIINCLKKDSKNIDLLKFYNEDMATSSFLILGKDEKAKQKLIDFYVKQAKESDVVIENFKYVLNDNKADCTCDNIQDFMELTKKCAERFKKENKLSLIVVENAEGFLKEENIGPAMGTWNILSQGFNKQGISAITTAKKLEELNESAVRGGRLDYWIDIDKMANEISEKL